MYKLAAIDLDGTLLTPDRKITPRSADAIKSWQSNGLRVVLATARPFYRIEKYLRRLDLSGRNDYAISFNGGLVMRADGLEQIYSHSFTKEEVVAVVSYGKNLDAPIFLYLEDRILSNRDDPLYREKNPDVDFSVVDDLAALDYDQQPVYKIAYVGSPEAVKKMRKELPRRLDQGFEVSSSVPQFVDFVPLGTSKAKALEMIGERLGISRDEMVAFGDEDNDVPLLEFAGLGVAMHNASDAVKEIADKVCESNADEGVARTLEFLLAHDATS